MRGSCWLAEALRTLHGVRYSELCSSSQSAPNRVFVCRSAGILVLVQFPSFGDNSNISFCAGLREYWFSFRRSVTTVTLVIVRSGQVMSARMVYSGIVLRIAIKFYIEIKV